MGAKLHAVYRTIKGGYKCVACEFFGDLTEGVKHAVAHNHFQVSLKK